MSTLDFTWADATGWSKSMPVRPPPLTARGARESPPRPRMSAPIRLRGWMTRSMGRASRDSSPVSTLKKGCEASSPVTSLAAVPLLPASSTFEGSTRPPVPRPRTSKHSSAPLTAQSRCSMISTPRPLMQPSMEVRSSPSQRLDTCAVRWRSS